MFLALPALAVYKRGMVFPSAFSVVLARRDHRAPARFWILLLAIGFTRHPLCAVEPVPDTFPQEARSFLGAYCFECHGNGAAEGEVDLEQLLQGPNDRATRDRWRKVMRQLQVGVMPPADYEPRPEQEVSARFVQSIDDRFFRVDCEQVRDPGRVTIRRLNRVEYENTVRDLLGVPFRAAATFPRDDVGYGFDNIGDVLSLTPPLLEKYLDAASAISRQVIHAGPRANLFVQRYEGVELDATLESGATVEEDYLLINREGYAFAEFNPYVSGEYQIRVRAFGVQAGDELIRMAVTVADKQVGEFEIQGHREPHDYEVSVSFGTDDYPLGRQEIHLVYLNDFNDGGEGDRDMAVLHVEMQGPMHLEPQDMPYPSEHRRAVPFQPDAKLNVEQAARRNLMQLGRRAFRRPVDSEDVDAMVDLVSSAVSRGESFERAMQYGLQLMLVSPRFLFRVESSPRPDDAEHAEDVGQFELASRLSYFLWCSMPDEELFRLAKEGTLSRRDVLVGQVQRMLDDSKSSALIDQFAGQWLNLRNLKSIRPNKQAFPEFDEELAGDMRRETQLLFETLLKDNKPLTELLTADYTYVNQRLAKHYGLPAIAGDGFQRVSLADVPRRGILTHASILTLTSDPARTLPVKRGKWIMANVLGNAPPEPPPNVPTLDVSDEAQSGTTLREQLARHREDAACAGCHRHMDPLGLAFEPYDAIGRWRETDGGQAFDTSGTLPDGRHFANVMELIGLLGDGKNEYTEQVAEAMLTFALGRGLEPYDQCAVEKIVEMLEQDDYRFRTLVNEIVLSEPFRRRRGDGGKP